MSKYLDISNIVRKFGQRNSKMKKMKAYRLYKGFNKIGEFDTIMEAKKNAPKEDGVYNLKGDNYRDSWQIINGTYYGD